MGKEIIPCIKEGLENYVEKEFKEILDFQYATFETKEDLANCMVETILQKEILNYKNSLRRLKEPVTRKDLVDSLMSELVSIRDEIYVWLTEPDLDPNEEYIFRTPIAEFEKRKLEEPQRIKKDIIDQGFTIIDWLSALQEHDISARAFSRLFCSTVLTLF